MIIVKELLAPRDLLWLFLLFYECVAERWCWSIQSLNELTRLNGVLKQVVLCLNEFFSHLRIADELFLFRTLPRFGLLLTLCLLEILRIVKPRLLLPHQGVC